MSVFGITQMQWGLACPVQHDFSCPLSFHLIHPRMNEHADKDNMFVLLGDQALVIPGLTEIKTDLVLHLVTLISCRSAQALAYS